MQPCKVRVLCLGLQLVICKTVTRSSRLSSPPDECRAWTSGSLHSSQQTQPRPGPKQLHSDLSDVKPFQQRLPWPSKVIFTWFHNRLPFCTSAQLSVLSRQLNPLQIITLGAALPLTTFGPGEPRVSWVLPAGMGSRTSREMDWPSCPRAASPGDPGRGLSFFTASLCQKILFTSALTGA